MTENTELMVLQKLDLISTFTKEGGARSVIDRIKEEVKKIDLDISTAKGEIPHVTIKY